MEIDTNTTAAVGGTGLAGFAAFWFWLKNLKRQDTKAQVIDESWKGIVTELRAEIEHLKLEVKELRAKVDNCEASRAKMAREFAGVKSRAKKTTKP